MMENNAAAWRHKKSGAYYNILAFALREADLAPMIVYRAQIDGTIWIRPKAEFFAKFEPGFPTFALEVSNATDAG